MRLRAGLLGALAASATLTALAAGLREWLCPLRRPEPPGAVWIAPVAAVGNPILPKVGVLEIGDLDGDGTRDLWVVVPWAYRSEPGIQVLSGATGRQIRAWSDANRLRPDCGYSAANVGDVDQDSYEDLAFVCEVRRLSIASGRTGEELAKVDDVGGAIRAIEAVGDFDADGIGDFGLSLECPDPRVQIRSSRTRAVLHEWSYVKQPHEVPPVCFDFEWVLCRADDVDGDGVSDVVIGAPPGRPSDKVDFASRKGFVEARSGRDGRAIWHINGMWEGEQWPTDLSPLGDQDGDGITDLLIGSEGRIEVASGRTGALLVERDGPLETDWGIQAEDAGDFDGDGRCDLLVICTNEDIHSGLPFGCGGFFEILSGLTGEVLHGNGLARESYQGELIPVGDLDGDGRADLVQTFPIGSRGDVDFPCCDSFRPPSSWIALISGADAVAPHEAE
jgi:hypothetical protein